MTACTRNGRACRGRRTTAHQTDTLGGCRSLQHWLVWLAVVGEWELLLPPLWRDDRSIRSARLGKGSRVYRGGVTGSPSQHGAYERGTPDRSAVPYAPAISGRACWDGVAVDRPAGAADLEASLRFVLFGGWPLQRWDRPASRAAAPLRLVRAEMCVDGRGGRVMMDRTCGLVPVNGMPPLPGEKIGI